MMKPLPTDPRAAYHLPFGSCKLKSKRAGEMESSRLQHHSCHGCHEACSQVLQNVDEYPGPEFYTETLLPLLAISGVWCYAKYCVRLINTDNALVFFFFIFFSFSLFLEKDQRYNFRCMSRREMDKCHSYQHIYPSVHGSVCFLIHTVTYGLI